MALWEQLWIWQIVVPIIGAVAGSALFYYLSHREKVEINYATMLAILKTDEGAGIKIECSFTLLYTKGTRDHYVSQIWLELHRRFWEKLFPYFEIPLKITFNQDEQPKLEPGKPKWLGFDWWCPARKSKVVSQEKYKNLEDITQKLWHRYKIGWKDTYGKTQTKTINQLKEIQELL